MAMKKVNGTTMVFDFNVEKDMTVFADSLNNLPKESPWPTFLFDACFDWKLAYWPNSHQPVSLRQMVVSKVTNRSVIEKILKDDDPLLRKICEYKSLPVPDSEKPFYELFRLRYAELNK